MISFRFERTAPTSSREDSLPISKTYRNLEWTIGKRTSDDVVSCVKRHLCLQSSQN